MRTMLVVLVFVLSATASAQQQAPSHRPPTPPPPPPTTAPRTVAPPIVFPLPPLPPQPAGGLTSPVPFTPVDPTRAPRDLYRVPLNRPYNTRSHYPLFGGYGGGYPYGDFAEPLPPQQEPQPPFESGGMLRLNVTPASAQVYVDSYYVGSVADVDARRVLDLSPGPHRIEIRAGDHEPLTFDVRIAPNETVTYRGALEPARPAAPARTGASAAAATRMFVIPNCYLGNVPPRADHLPRGCDVKQVRVVGGP